MFFWKKSKHTLAGVKGCEFLRVAAAGRWENLKEKNNEEGGKTFRRCARGNELGAWGYRMRKRGKGERFGCPHFPGNKTQHDGQVPSCRKGKDQEKCVFWAAPTEAWKRRGGGCGGKRL